MQINSYSFGKMEIEGKVYTSDLIVCSNRIIENWWREQGHNLSYDDLKEIFYESPAILVIGTGSAGVMNVPDATKMKLEKLGFQLIIRKTREAVNEFNKKFSKTKTIGAFHLTC